MRFSRLITLLLLVAVSSLRTAARCEPALSGRALSDEVLSIIAEGGFGGRAAKEPLAKTGLDTFAYNITVDFPRTEEAVTGGGRSTMVVDIRQRDIPTIAGEFTRLLKDLDGRKRNADVRILCAALDGNGEAEGGEYGTERFASEVDDNDTMFAVALDFGAGGAASIKTGSVGSASPSWLAKLVTDAMRKDGQAPELEHRLLSLYRLGLIRGGKRMGEFIKWNIPAIEVALQDGKQLGFIAEIAESFDARGTEEWDVHYLIIDTSTKFGPLVIGESAIITLAISVAALSLLMLCGLSFLGKAGARYKREFLKAWYMIPLTLALSFSSVILGQKAAESARLLPGMNPIHLMSIKICASILVISAYFAVLEKIHLPIDAFIFGYMISFVAILNIFIFSAIDILFFISFGIEYILIFASRPARRSFWIMVWLAAMMAPFAPYIASLIGSAERETLERAIFCTPAENVILSLALFPIHMMWQKILVRINIISGMSRHPTRRTVWNGIALVLFLIAVFAFSSKKVSERFYRDTEKPATIIADRDNRTFSFNVVEDTFWGMSTNHIAVKSKEDAVRYKISIRSDGEEVIPIYESTYGYTITAKDEIAFVIPDMPPRSITIDYASSSALSSFVTVEAIYDCGDGTFRRERKTVRVQGKR